MGSGWSSWPPSPTPGCWPRSWRRRWGCGRSLARRGPPPRRQRPTGWPASSATRFCWLSWTTASTWWPAAPSWSCGCCGPRRGCGCWPPAARSWGCRGSWSGRSRPWPSPTRHPSRDQGAAGTAPAQRCWPAMTGCGCSWSGPTWPTRASSSTATVDWSFQLREEPDRRLFRRLSVFAGGWTVAAAEAVTGDAGGVLEGLVRLVDRSLVVAVGGDPARFRMLETLRAYGADRLAEAGETELTAARHTAWFVDLAEEAATNRTGRRWTRRLEADYDNLRAAIDRAMAGGDHQTALRIGGALGWYWQEYHTEEGRQRLAGALALAEGEPPTIHLARTLLSSSMIELQRFPTLPEVTAARRSLELFERFGEPVGAATAKVLLALAELQHRGPSGDATRLVAEAEDGFKTIHDRWGEAYAALVSLTVHSYHLGPPGQAEEVGRRALERFEALDDHWGRALALYALANLARRRGELDAAVGRYEQAIAVAREDGPLWMLCASLVELGGLVAVEGEIG